MVDFKELIQQRKAERAAEDMRRGWCVLPDPVYMKGTIRGFRTRGRTTTEVELTWTIEPGSRDRNIKSNRIICFAPGVTGWESYNMDIFMNANFQTNEETGNRWYLCAGDMKWDSLWVYKNDMIEIYNLCKKAGY